MTGPLDETTTALVGLAGAIAAGDTDSIRCRVARAMSVRVPALAVDELILQSVLTVGWPRALVAAGIWREMSDTPAPASDVDADYTRHNEWARLGEVTCRTIYGDRYEQLRTNVGALHPALESWMVVEGYGRTLARPGLSLDVRELCTVAQIAVLDTPRQLHSHLLGALRAGASPEAVGETLDAVRQFSSQSGRSHAAELWKQVRERWKAAP
ncbi:MAG: carboxymuconolactone decarboxylase family protein [Gemmatimonadales bacterium]